MNRESIKLDGKIYDVQQIELLRRDNEPVDSWRNSIFTFLKNWYDNSEFITAQTSGSTGTPKTIRLSKQSMKNSARMTNEFFGLDSFKTALLCLPASYIAGKMMLVRALVGGFNLITVQPSANPFEFIHSAIDFVAVTPYQLHHSADTLRQRDVKNIIVGGGHVNSKLEEIVQSLSAKFYETYGMTETCSHIALRCFNGIEKSDYFSVLNGVTVRQDERDCLVINAPHLLDKEIVTNDIVELQSENSFKWLGRFDSVINSGGIKIHPELIEKKLERLISQNFFISSIPDELLERKVVLVIESAVFSDEELKNLRTKMELVFEKYELPKQILFLPEFIYSSGNKILKKETLDKILFV